MAECGGVQYEGDLCIPGVPSSGCPVALKAIGIAGTQTGSLLPTGNASDRFTLGETGKQIECTLIDFARALVVLNAESVLPHFGYDSIADATKDRIEADSEFMAALEHVRRAASLSMGMGDCAGKDAPKICLVSTPKANETISCIYFVNPERSEMHPSIAMTAAQALGAACLLDGSVIQSVMQKEPDADGCGNFSFSFSHPKGTFPVEVGVSSETCNMFPKGEPSNASYATTVRPIAEGQVFI